MSQTKKIYEEITDEELKALTNAIKIRFGIDFTRYESKSLKRGFARLMGKHNLDSLIDLWSLLLEKRDFFKSCLDDLTVNLTELFRNPEIWTVVEELLLSQKHESSINIWHAGCSTGEEVYSMSYIVHKNNLEIKTNLLGTDISKRALEKATIGKYSAVLEKKYQQAFKKFLVNSNLKEMFESDGRNMQIIKRFQRICSFKNHNLASDTIEDRYNLIFCRNVMIYFDDELKMMVLKKLLSALKPGGFLILGYYDMLPDESRNLITAYNSDNRVYQMKEEKILYQS